MNAKSQKPADLKVYEEVLAVREPNYDNVDGQDSLNRFDSAFTKNKKRKKKKKPGGPVAEGAAVVNPERRPRNPEALGKTPRPQQQKRRPDNRNKPAGEAKAPNPNQQPGQPRPPRQPRPQAEGAAGSPAAEGGERPANPNKRRNNRRRPPRPNNGPNEHSGS
jgi:hypothetical protein